MVMIHRTTVTNLLFVWTDINVDVFGIRWRGTAPKARTYSLTSEKAEKLGVHFTSVEESLEECVASLRNKGFLPLLYIKHLRIGN